jgi:protein gp37
MTGIQWTDKTWNPLAGCSKKSEGCQNCYAIPMAARLESMAIALEADRKNSGRLEHYKGLTKKTNGRIEWTGQVNVIPEAMRIPSKWKKPRRIFVNSMSDLFHESVPSKVLDQVFAVMALTPQHTYQILTKRPDLMADYCNNFTIEQLRRGAEAAELTVPRVFGKGFCALPNVWLGVTIENQRAADERIPLLLQTPAALRFLSCEPLLGEVNFADGLPDWVIVGGESGHGARSTQLNYIDSIARQCQAAKVPVFVKQLGAKPITGMGYSWPISDRKGAIVEEWPEYLQVREFPAEVTHGT